MPYNFIPFAITGGANLHEAAPGANDWNCRPSAAHPEPVVLAHGLFGNANTNWQTYSPLLANEGYCVYALTYGTLPNATLPLNLFGGLTTIESSAAELAAFVDRCSPPPARQGRHRRSLRGHRRARLLRQVPRRRDEDRQVRLPCPLWHGTDLAGSVAPDRARRAGGAQRPAAVGPSAR